MEDIREGYIVDYISGLQVKETPEEIEAVQPFAKILVQDYGYPKEYIHTRPQYRVKVRPSDTRKEYPVDIAVFTDKTSWRSASHATAVCMLSAGTAGRRNSIFSHTESIDRIKKIKHT